MNATTGTLINCAWWQKQGSPCSDSDAFESSLSDPEGLRSRELILKNEVLRGGRIWFLDPKPTVFKRFLHQFEESGSVNYKKPITSKSVTEDEENVFAVIGSVIENPNVSQNLISKSTNISQSSISRIIKKYNFYPYKIQLCQELYGNDFENLTEFCMWVLDNEIFFENVLFSDECTFHKNGLVSRHNFHYYSDTNPRANSVMKNKNRWSVNVWGGILGQYLIGPYFFEGHLNGLMFLQFLINHLSILLVPFNIKINMWLQLDGAPPQYHCEKWVSKLAPQISGLNSTRFLFVGYIKGIVYHTLPTTSHDLKTGIRDAFKTVTPQMLSRVSSCFEKRIYKLFGDGARSSRQVTEEFNMRHAQRNPIRHKTAAGVNLRFSETGIVLNSALHAQLRNRVRANPQMSLRLRTVELNVSKGKIRRCLIRHKIKPFEPKCLHTLRQGDRIIGPFFVYTTLNAERLLNFVNNQLWGIIVDLPINVRQEMLFQLGGATIHYRLVRDWLNRYLPLRWIGRNSPFE
ncbi:hypothetical protein D910_07077, partial [Dendroctonus ponderosae]